MANAQLKAPKTIEDLRYKHLSAFTSESFQLKGHNPDVDTIVKFVAAFFGIVEPMVLRMEYKDLQKVYRHCVSLWSTFGLKALPKEIEVNGKCYDLVDLKRPPAGWVIDSDASDFEADPVRLACICYIPTGTKYGDIDENENLLHPIAQRYDDFKEHFPLVLHCHLSAFFLQRYLKYAKRYTAIERAKTKAKRLKPVRLIGWWRSIFSRKNTAYSGTKSRA